MKKAVLSCLAMLMATFTLFANDDDSLVAKLQQYIRLVDSVNAAMKYETGKINLPGGAAQLNIPQGFKYLNAGQSNYVLTELWGNPPRADVIGMIFPEKSDPFNDSSYAFVITYEAIGYVKDEDADKIDYDQMLKDIQKDEIAENLERQKMGYPPIHIVGWAQKPYYDKTNKILHWAKELKFGEGSDENTLNYDIRILGRKGILSLNAVGGMNELNLVKADINKVLHIATFTEGNKYSDFDPDIDNVAAWTIGGLVAGKVLAKVGIFAGLAKFLKFIIIGIVAAAGAVIKFFKGKKKQEQIAYEPVPPPADNQSNA